MSIMLMRAAVRNKAFVMGLLVLLCVAPAMGQETGPEGDLQDVIGRQDQDASDTRITLSVKDKPLEDVIKYIREQAQIMVSKD